MLDNILIIHPEDNVAVALIRLASGEQVTAKGMKLMSALEEIPASHKVALRDISAGRRLLSIEKS